MIVASWNVNSINKRLPVLLNWLEKLKPNLVALQETKVVDDKFPCDEFLSRGYHLEFVGEKSYNGVALVSDKPLEKVEKELLREVGPASKRFISAVYEGVRVVNLYIPNGSEPGSEKYAYKLEWLKALKEHFQDRYSNQEPVLVMGDFNVATEDIDVYDPKLLAGGILVSEEERKFLQDFKDWGLVDVFRRFHKQEGLYTWWDYRMNSFRRNLGLRIDHIWATPILADAAQSIYIDREPRKLEETSDHAPLVCSFTFA